MDISYSDQLIFLTPTSILKRHKELLKNPNNDGIKMSVSFQTCFYELTYIFTLKMKMKRQRHGSSKYRQELCQLIRMKYPFLFLNKSSI